MCGIEENRSGYVFAFAAEVDRAGTRDERPAEQPRYGSDAGRHGTFERTESGRELDRGEPARAARRFVRVSPRAVGQANAEWGRRRRAGWDGTAAGIKRRHCRTVLEAAPRVVSTRFKRGHAKPIGERGVRGRPDRRSPSERHGRHILLGQHVHRRTFVLRRAALGEDRTGRGRGRPFTPPTASGNASFDGSRHGLHAPARVSSVEQGRERYASAASAIPDVRLRFSCASARAERRARAPGARARREEAEHCEYDDGRPMHARTLPALSAEARRVARQRAPL